MESPSGNPVDLTESEFESLLNVVEGDPIPNADRARLIELGLIAEIVDGLVPTDDGRARFARGR